MTFIQPGLCALLLAAGAGWAAWLTAGDRPADIAAIVLGAAVAASLLVYFAGDRKDSFLWLRVGLYGGALAVACASLWTGAARPLLHVPSFGAALAWLEGLGGMRLVMFVAPPVGEGATPALVCPECVDLADVVVAECPLVGDETAEYVCGRCAAPIRKAEAVLYP